jgi:hypothetical protein
MDLREAWERLRETAVEYGDQRIYASHNSIMFSRRSCYFFVRPKRSFLEVCIFLGRPLKVPAVRRVIPASKTKFAHLLRVKHRDEVEAPITDWLQEAYEFAGDGASKLASSTPARSKPTPKRAAGRTVGRPARARRGTTASAGADRTKTAKTAKASAPNTSASVARRRR